MTLLYCVVVIKLMFSQFQSTILLFGVQLLIVTFCFLSAMCPCYVLADLILPPLDLQRRMVELCMFVL